MSIRRVASAHLFRSSRRCRRAAVEWEFSNSLVRRDDRSLAENERSAREAFEAPISAPHLLLGTAAMRQNGGHCLVTHSRSRGQASGAYSYLAAKSLRRYRPRSRPAFSPHCREVLARTRVNHCDVPRTRGTPCYLVVWLTERRPLSESQKRPRRFSAPSAARRPQKALQVRL